MITPASPEDRLFLLTCAPFMIPFIELAKKLFFEKVGVSDEIKEAAIPVMIFQFKKDDCENALIDNLVIGLKVLIAMGIKTSPAGEIPVADFLISAREGLTFMQNKPYCCDDPECEAHVHIIKKHLQTLIDSCYTSMEREEAFVYWRTGFGAITEDKVDGLPRQKSSD